MNRKIIGEKMNSVSTFPQKVYIESTYGACNRRKLDAQRLVLFFKANGYSVVANPEGADVIFLVTCAVSNDRENGSIRRICDLKKFHGELIVCGCLPGINQERLSSVHNGKSIPTLKLFSMDDYFPNMQVKFTELGDANYYLPTYKRVFSNDFIQTVRSKWNSLEGLSLNYIIRKKIPGFIRGLTTKKNIESTHFPIRISWGCNANCSYCSIRFAVGKFQSKPLETCRNELLEGLRRGARKIELIADNVGMYGLDIDRTFPDLLNILTEVDGDFDIQIWNLSPVWLVKYQVDLVPVLQKGKISEIHFPIQSGSEKILKAMNRYSNVGKTKESISVLKKHSPHLTLTTDIIIGFPGETEEDVNKTIELIRFARFRMIDIFKYYDARNTASSNLLDKIHPSVIAQRVRKVRREIEKMQLDYQIS